MRKIELSLVIGALLLSSCAKPTTQLAPVSLAAVRVEEARQREIVLIELNKAQQRLDDISFELLLAAARLCQEDVAPRLGISFATDNRWGEEYQDAARSALGLSGAVTITSVSSGSPAEEAGIQEGDELLAVEGSASFASLRLIGNDVLEVATEGIRSAALTGSVSLTIKRSGNEREVSVTPERVCAYPASVEVEGPVNAYADGERVVVTWAMMRFANDDELRTIVGHEIAHNAMKHIDAQKKNALLGGLFGALLDAATEEVLGIPSRGENTAALMNAGRASHSQDFEREADYVGMYILARANMDLGLAPDVWRQMGQISPGAIAYASSHPSTAERFVRLTQTIEEIERKRSMGIELLPEMRERN